MTLGRFASLLGLPFATSLLLATTLVACGDDSITSDGGGGSGGESDDGGAPEGGSGTGGAPEPICTEPVAVPCEDEVILQMNLKDTPTDGVIENQADGDGFISIIDATAGGAFAADPESYTYGKFTDTGMEKVNISDEEALASMDWDISFRRYIGRINSGHSGPSCVAAGRLPGDPPPEYDSVDAVPEGLTFRNDEYFTESCELIADGTGLEGSPATAIASYWEYPGCVQMTGNVYVVRLADGRMLKLTVTHFYNDEAQTQCQEQESVPMSNNGSGNIQIRWAFL